MSDRSGIVASETVNPPPFNAEVLTRAIASISKSVTLTALMVTVCARPGVVPDTVKFNPLTCVQTNVVEGSTKASATVVDPPKVRLI